MPRAFPRLFLCVLALAPACAGAAVFRDVRYAEATDAQSLDVYTPIAPGPHPVVLHFHAGAGEDKSVALVPAAAFTARGYVFLAANYRVDASGAGPDALEDAAAAIAWVGRRVSSYGGDPERLFVVGIGEGAHAATLAASDARRLARHGAMQAPKGVVALAAPAYELEAAAAARAELRESIESRFGSDPARWRAASPALLAHPGDAPRLLLFDARTQAARRDAERYADRLREAGVAAMLLPLAARASSRTLGAPLDADGNHVFAWLQARELPRLARWENVELALRSGAPALLRLAAHDGRLFGIDREGGGWRRDSAGGAWQREPGDGSLAWLGTLARAGGETLVALVRQARGTIVRMRDEDGEWRDVATLPGLSCDGSAHAFAHRDAASGAPAWFLACGDAPPLRVHAPGDAVEAAPAVVERGIEGSVRAFASAGGVLYAAVGADARGAGRTGLYRRNDGADVPWTHVTAFLTTDPDRHADATALASVPDPAGSGREVLLVGFDDGRIARVDPAASHSTTTELEAGSAFRELWADDAVRAAIAGDGFVALRQPESGDLVHVVALRMHRRDRAAGHDGAYFLARQLDGTYAYGLAHDFDSGTTAARGDDALVRSIVASPFVRDAGRAAWFAAGTQTNPRLLRATLASGGVPRGLWWDRTRPGQGIDVQRVDSRWLVFVYTYDERAQPTWYLASGEVDAARFAADGDRLARLVLDGDGAQQRDADGSGDLELRFALAPDETPCASAARPGARELAHARIVLRGRSEDWCLEPFRFGADGVPRVDPSGLWSGGPVDPGWGLSLHAQGFDGTTRETAIVFHHDGEGAPRWLLGSGDVADGTAELVLHEFAGACPGCAARALESRPAATLVHRFGGLCGETRGEITLVARAGTISGQARRSGRALQRESEAGCY